MELTMTARGRRVTDQERRRAERKLGRLERIQPRLTRLQVEVIAEPNPRRGGTRVEATAEIPRKIFRAHGEGPDVDVALDQVAERLERQLRDHAGKRRKRPSARTNRLDSAAGAGPAGPDIAG